MMRHLRQREGAWGWGSLRSAWRLVSSLLVRAWEKWGAARRLLREARRMGWGELWNEFSCILQKQNKKTPRKLCYQGFVWSNLTFHPANPNYWGLTPCSVSLRFALISLRSGAGVYSPSGVTSTLLVSCLGWAVGPLRTASCLVWLLLSLPAFPTVCSSGNMQYLKFGDQFFSLSLVG